MGQLLLNRNDNTLFVWKKSSYGIRDALSYYSPIIMQFCRRKKRLITPVLWQFVGCSAISKRERCHLTGKRNPPGFLLDSVFVMSGWVVFLGNFAKFASVVLIMIQWIMLVEQDCATRECLKRGGGYMHATYTLLFLLSLYGFSEIHGH